MPEAGPQPPKKIKKQHIQTRKKENCFTEAFSKAESQDFAIYLREQESLPLM